MLNQVPEKLRAASRLVVLRHPNGMDAVVMRRRVTRTVGADSGQMGGLPTLGGLGVLEADDEPEVDYAPLGDARVVFSGMYQPAEMADRGDAPDQPAEAEALVEPVEAGAFTSLKDGDLVMVMPGAGVVIPYEVTKVMNMVNIPPYLTRYVLAVQGDLMFDPAVAGVAGGA